MAWDVEFTSQFGTWWNSLSPDEQVEISAKVEPLQEPRPTPAPPSCGRDFHFPPSEHEGVARQGRGPAPESALRV